MVERTKGLVLRIRPLTETSLIVHWLTPEMGRIATVAKGALRPKSPFRGKLDLFYEGEFNFLRSRRSDLHTLREFVLLGANAGLRKELGLLQQASYAALLVEQTTETETPLGEIHKLMTGFLDSLPLAAPDAKNVLSFELKLLAFLGLGADPAQSRLCPLTQKAALTLAREDWFNLRNYRLEPSARQEIEGFLHGYIIYHLGRLASGRAAALAAGQL